MDIEETRLPGIGLRHELVTREGRRIGVISQRGGVRHVLLYDERDPDAAPRSIELAAAEAEAVGELLGATRVTERMARLQEQVAGLATATVTIEAGSRYADATLGDTAIRTRTGASVVAVVRGEQMLASPAPDFAFQAGDRLVVVGTDNGVRAVGALITPS